MAAAEASAAVRAVMMKEGCFLEVKSREVKSIEIMVKSYVSSRAGLLGLYSSLAPDG
jgi:hypothetical protein